MSNNHRISQEARRRKEADARIEADAAERSAQVLDQAKAYTNREIAALEERLSVMIRTKGEHDPQVVELRARLRAV